MAFPTEFSSARCIWQKWTIYPNIIARGPMQLHRLHRLKAGPGPIILDAELYTTCPGKRVLVVMTHQVQCNIPTFEALLRKNMHLFLERCRRSNNVRLPALTQSDCLYSSLFFEHYNCVWLWDWVLRHCSVYSFEDVHVTMHSHFTWPWPV